MSSVIVCKTRLLTASQAANSMRRGLEINPANAIEHATLAANGRGGGQPLSGKGYD